MQDQTAQPVQSTQVSPSTSAPPQISYVDAYTPPSAPLVPSAPPATQSPASQPSVSPLPPSAPVQPVPQMPVGEVLPPEVRPMTQVDQEPAQVSTPAQSVGDQPLVTTKVDPQQALDDLAKMFEDPGVQSAAQPAQPDQAASPEPSNVVEPIMASEPIISAQPADVSPVLESAVADYPVEQQTETTEEAIDLGALPVPPAPVTPAPPVMDVASQTPKSSEELLAEIDQALHDKQVDPNMVQNSLNTTADSVSTNDQVTPPVPTVQDSPDSSSLPPVKSSSEAIEDQNIFHLLGIEDSSQEQKDQFLSELQQVIWEDFLEHDVELLLTESEYQELKQQYHVDQKKPLAEQEEVIVYLEKLIPDLENLMLEKAIKLKADLVKERVISLREKFATQADKLAELDKADALIGQEKWLSTGQALNALA